VIEQKTQNKMRIHPVTGTIVSGYRASYYQDPRTSASNPTGFPTSVSVLSWENL
jgi:hypothetical protein